MMREAFMIALEQDENNRFHVHFDRPDVAPLLVDEPAPLAGNAGPNAAPLVGPPGWPTARKRACCSA